MKALLDEQLSNEIARVLRGRGLDVEAVCERSDLVEASDEYVCEVAAREQRAVVTNDIKDFRPIAAARLADGRGHAGLILLPARSRRDRSSTGILAEAVERVMRAHPAGIPDAEHWIAPVP